MAVNINAVVKAMYTCMLYQKIHFKYIEYSKYYIFNMNNNSRENDENMEENNLGAVDEEIVMLLPPFHKGQIGIFVMVVFLFCAHGKHMQIQTKLIFGRDQTFFKILR